MQMSNARLDDRRFSKFLNQRFSPSRSVFLLFLLLILALIPELVFSRLFIINSNGYVSGRLSGVSLERAFNHAYIGEVTLGRDSITFMSYGNQPHNLVTNPWQFCFEKDRYDEIKSYIGQNIVLEFKTPKSTSLLSCSAINELVAVYPVDEYQALEQTHLIGDIRTNNPEIAKGIEFGRIVNVIKNRGSYRNYFMTIQIGGGGSKFRHFVMEDPDLFAFSIKSLKTAAITKIHYSERHTLSNSSGLNSMSFVSEIEIID
jgi:hypothetical protein